MDQHAPVVGHGLPVVVVSSLVSSQNGAAFGAGTAVDSHPAAASPLLPAKPIPPRPPLAAAAAAAAAGAAAGTAVASAQSLWEALLSLHLQVIA